MTLASLSQTFSSILFLGMIAGIPLYGYLRKIKVYDVFVEGAKDGFHIAIKIVPYLLAILVAIGMLRASGALQLLTRPFTPLLHWLNLPPDILTLALMRPLSGSASNGILVEIIHNYGADSFAAKVAATMMGSTETTFYVIALYFGAVAIKRTRHAIPAGLIADAAGIIAAIIICRLIFA